MLLVIGTGFLFILSSCRKSAGIYLGKAMHTILTRAAAGHFCLVGTSHWRDPSLRGQRCLCNPCLTRERKMATQPPSHPFPLRSHFTAFMSASQRRFSETMPNSGLFFLVFQRRRTDAFEARWQTHAVDKGCSVRDARAVT